MGDSTPVVNHAHRFAPAAPDEEIVFGACSPGWHSAANHDAAVADWISFARDRGIERVCCLLAGRQDNGSQPTVGRYRQVFGEENVCHAPSIDGHLIDAATLQSDVIPFLDASEASNSPVVVHCLSGLGRTGQVLAAWLVADRGYEPSEAVATVRETGRDPREAIQQGNATFSELRSLLASVR